MMTPEEQKKLAECLSTNKIAEAVVKKQIGRLYAPYRQPIGGTANNRAYYTPHYAEKIRPFIDQMIETKQDSKILFADYPQWKPKTIQLRIIDSIQFLRDYDETPDKKYQKWREMVSLNKIKDSKGKWIGLLFMFPKESDELKFYPVTHEESKAIINNDYEEPVEEPSNEISEWRASVEEFIAASDKESIKITELNLAPEEVDFVKKLLNPEVYTFFVSSKMIVIRKGKIVEEQNEA